MNTNKVKLNILIDGTWLFNVCKPGNALARKTVKENSVFRINFKRFNDATKIHLKNQGIINELEDCDLGELYLSTSIFTLPDDFDSWPTKYNIPEKHIKKTKSVITARKIFVENAINAGYKDDAIYKPVLKDYHLQNLINGQLQEKQVDTTIVALLVKLAIVNSINGNQNHYYGILTGDADILPAIKVAYPEFTKNVFIITTRPDDNNPQHRQSAFSLSQFQTEIKPMYLNDYVANIMDGNYVYTCHDCNRVFSRNKKLSDKIITPYCNHCLHKFKQPQ